MFCVKTFCDIFNLKLQIHVYKNANTIQTHDMAIVSNLL
jgi:hypothetical protein